MCVYVCVCVALCVRVCVCVVSQPASLCYVRRCGGPHRYEDVLARPAVAQQRLSQFLQMQEPGEEEFGLKYGSSLLCSRSPVTVCGVNADR